MIIQVQPIWWQCQKQGQKRPPKYNVYNDKDYTILKHLCCSWRSPDQMMEKITDMANLKKTQNYLKSLRWSKENIQVLQLNSSCLLFWFEFRFRFWLFRFWFWFWWRVCPSKGRALMIHCPADVPGVIRWQRQLFWQWWGWGRWQLYENLYWSWWWWQRRQWRYDKDKIDKKF